MPIQTVYSDAVNADLTIAVGRNRHNAPVAILLLTEPERDLELLALWHQFGYKIEYHKDLTTVPKITRNAA